MPKIQSRSDSLAKENASLAAQRISDSVPIELGKLEPQPRREAPNASITLRKDHLAEKCLGRAIAPAFRADVDRRNFQIKLLVSGKRKEISRRGIGRPICDRRARQVIKNNGHFRKAIHDLPQKRDRLRLHLHADRNAPGCRVLPERICPRIGKPYGLIRERAAGREQTHTAAAAREPVIESLHRVGRQNIDGIHSRETRRNGCDRISHVAVVVAISGRRMHDRRLLDAGGIHFLQQHFVGSRPLARPSGLRAAKRRQGIPLDVRRDDVGMDVDDGHANSHGSAAEPIMNRGR